ncbi:hypothetical protein [Amycolatopsis sp. CA-128772]|uniref:hypothetical protein n=1 Tax=Amycolatopsis sp. CA-128772 TaxID=2073159 RepID=UPI001E46D940|nr:hypothetical protein [Amycolatopsis sp. CA-128772]
MATEGPLTAAQIYEQITGGEGINSLADAHDGASQLTDRMVERAQRISALRAKTMSGWRGRAGDAAADATLPLVQAAADDAVHLRNAQGAVGAQMDAFGTAKYSVKPVAAQPPELDIDDVRNVLTGHGWDSYTSKVAGWQADSQGNIDAFRAYHSASTDNGGQMPAQYAELRDSGSPVSMTGRSGPSDTGDWARDTQVPSQDRETFRPGQDHVTDRVTSQTTDDVRDQTANRPVSQDQALKPVQPPSSFQPSQPGNAGTTHADSYVPTPPVAQGGYVFGPTGQSGGWSGGGSFSGDFGPGTGSGYYSTGTGTGTGTGPGNGAGTNTGTNTGTGLGKPGTNLPGTRTPGNATGARLPEERLPSPTRATAGPRGANGLPMGAPVNGRGGKEEDREKKKAPYLQNPDPDETFGGFIEKPMPPVIGEKKNDRHLLPHHPPHRHAQRRRR